MGLLHMGRWRQARFLLLTVFCLLIPFWYVLPRAERGEKASFHQGIVGYIDEATEEHILGWVCILGVNDSKIVVELIIGGSSCGWSSLTIRRKDVRTENPQKCANANFMGFDLKPTCPFAQGGKIATMNAWVMGDPPHPVPFAGGFRISGPADGAYTSRILIHRRAPPIRVTNNAPIRLNILMNGVGVDLSGGPLSVMHFAVQAAKAGIHVRWLNLDGHGLNQAQLGEHLKKYAGLEEFGGLVEYVWNIFYVSEPIEMNPDDLSMATLYYTAYTAAEIQKKLRNPNFIYFIQDFEPLFFAHNSDYLQALETYDLPHFPIFSTSFLRDYFVQSKLGLYACHDAQANTFDWAAQPAIRRHASLNLSNPQVRTLIMYARRHAERNAFDFAVSALSAAVQAGVFDEQPWQFIGVGALGAEEICGLGGRPKVCLSVTVNVPEPMYLSMLANGDIGLSLMVSPHPSLPPFDFAAAGMVVVTNSFATKTAEGLAQISANIVATKPTIPAIVEGLKKAVQLSHDRFARQRAAKLNWAESWSDDRCYGPTLMKRVRSWFTHSERLDNCVRHS